MNNPLREKLIQGRATFGIWITLECPNVTEAAIEAGIDWFVVEMEHGHLDWRDVVNHLRVARAADVSALVRVADASRENIQRALDLGAHGVIVPMVGSQHDLERVYRLGRYPPRGIRGVGGERCVRWGLEFESYLNSANEQTMLIPLLETREAFENIDSILSVDGLEAVFFGPADMSASYGYLGAWEGGDVSKTILSMRDQAAKKRISSGILGRTSEEVSLRLDQGFHMIGLGADINLMLQSLQQSIGHARRNLKDS